MVSNNFCFSKGHLYFCHNYVYSIIYFRVAHITPTEDGCVCV